MYKERGAREDLLKVGGEEAARRLYQIWHMYELSPKRPENDSARQAALLELNKVLSEEAMAYLDQEVATEVDGNYTNPITRGVQVKMRARLDGVKVKASNRSKGEKLAVRRDKANQRRGTRRDLIH